jgi:hypothetical protein
MALKLANDFENPKTIKKRHKNVIVEFCCCKMLVGHFPSNYFGINLNCEIHYLT